MLLSRQLIFQSRRNRLIHDVKSLAVGGGGGEGTSSRRRDEQQQQPQRSFHATSKQEILPVLAVGTVLMIGRYSYKALNRMDQDWEDYQWQLQQYERQRRKEEATADAPTTIGVDLGTLYLKLSTLHAGRSQPELIPTAQGDRYRFTGILMKDDDDMVVGRPALDKFFYQQPNQDQTAIEEPVKLPYRELQKSSHDEAATLVQKVMLPPVGEAMERLLSSSSSETEGTNANSPNNADVRCVVTLPPALYYEHDGGSMFQNTNYHDKTHHTITVPDPVAAIWGAQTLDLLPTPQTKEEYESTTASTLVVDVGGLATSISLVRQDKVIASSTLEDVGGETFVQQLVYRILNEAEDDTLRQDPMCLALIHTSARSSILELVNKSQAKVQIPFLFMGRKPDNPHLEMTVSRTVLEQAAQDYWISSVVPKLMKEDVSPLSTNLPPPTNANALFTSAVTKVLEESGETPNNIQHILLVGGGSRHKLLEQACQEGIWALMGPSPHKLVLPEPSVRAELTALGAASLLPNFDYSYDKGLTRAE